tara:strand:- start:284 stop:568 length:285 start_codon:yes stop_codon:yes gene_type:complete
MKVLTMKKFKKLEDQILEKIENLGKLVETRTLKEQELDEVSVDNVNIISDLKRQNLELSDKLANLHEEHGRDLAKIDELLKALSALMEGDNARS